VSFSAAVWKCAARDAGIGWRFRHQYDLLHLVANNGRFLILPEHHYPNLASRVLALCERRLAGDWRERFGYPLLLLETFVDPRRFHGTLYRAATGMRWATPAAFAAPQGYSTEPDAAERVFVRPLHAQAQADLSRPVLGPHYCHGAPKILLSAEQMCALPDFFADIPCPRCEPSAGATLCGMCGYKALSQWAADLGQKARAHFRCCCYRNRHRHYAVPSRTDVVKRKRTPC